MQGKKLLWITLALTVVVTAARALLLPATAGDGVGITTVNYPLLLVLVAVAAVLLLLGGTKRGTTFDAVNEAQARAVAAAGMLFGVLLLGTSVWDAFNWAANGMLPPPNEFIRNNAERLALVATLLSGIVGGVFLLGQFAARRVAPEATMSPIAAWISGTAGALAGVTVVVLAVMNWRETTAQALPDPLRRRAMLTMVVLAAIGVALTMAFIRWLLRGNHTTGGLWLLTVVWLFARMARYDVAYATSVNVAPAVYDFLTYGVSLLFLLAAAQYFSGVLKPSRRLRGLAAATAALTLGAVLSRVVLGIMGKGIALMYCPLPSVVDVGLGLFALTLTTVPVKTAEETEENIAPTEKPAPEAE